MPLPSTVLTSPNLYFIMHSKCRLPLTSLPPALPSRIGGALFFCCSMPCICTSTTISIAVSSKVHTPTVYFLQEDSETTATTQLLTLQSSSIHRLVYTALDIHTPPYMFALAFDHTLPVVTATTVAQQETCLSSLWDLYIGLYSTCSKCVG